MSLYFLIACIIGIFGAITGGESIHAALVGRKNAGRAAVLGGITIGAIVFSLAFFAAGFVEVIACVL